MQLVFGCRGLCVGPPPPHRQRPHMPLNRWRLCTFDQAITAVILINKDIKCVLPNFCSIHFTPRCNIDRHASMPLRGGGGGGA